MSEAPTTPVCPRHPDRESYVRCQRCERPACPECQRPAAVGFQCVDCVREQNQGTRSARTVFGGGVRQGRPVVTLGIIAVCAVVWLLQLTDSRVTDWFQYAPVQTQAEPWRMLTAAFLHSPVTPLHILFNMYALYVTGPYLEALFGRARYLALYLISAFGGSVGFLLLASPGGDTWFTPTVGASGAVFGLFGAFFMVQRAMNRDTGQIVGVVLINLVLGFVISGVAWQAHLGGLATGVVAAGVLAYAPRARRTQVQWGGLAALVVLLVLVTVVKAATGPML
ncbi:rhomboid family intramembrane serine protease [Spongisporangium articulatum]|uniref:Rhomboid family intramembrane serine protease n=1 Tax=Spongisporangium articulatum TaxID=3362603 RepID=A0ABW8AI56_9ACTN